MTDILEDKRLVFPSKVENISIAERLVDDITEEYGVGEENYGNILIALTEAVNNAICHGNKSDESKDVLLVFKTDKDHLIFEIEDQGPGFDYHNLPDPTAPENIEQPNGRGVFLMQHLADEVNFNETGSVVELKFNHKFSKQ